MTRTNANSWRINRFRAHLAGWIMHAPAFDMVSGDVNCLDGCPRFGKVPTRFAPLTGTILQCT